jgi:transaldolase
MKEYQHLVHDAIQYSSNCDDMSERLNLAMDKLAVNFGVEISKLVPGNSSDLPTWIIPAADELV